MLWRPNGLCHIILDVFMEKMIFLDFSRSGTQIEGKQNTISTTALSLSNTSSAMRDVE